MLTLDKRSSVNTLQTSWCFTTSHAWLPSHNSIFETGSVARSLAYSAGGSAAAGRAKGNLGGPEKVGIGKRVANLDVCSVPFARNLLEVDISVSVLTNEGVKFPEINEHGKFRIKTRIGFVTAMKTGKENFRWNIYWYGVTAMRSFEHASRSCCFVTSSSCGATRRFREREPSPEIWS